MKKLFIFLFLLFIPFIAKAEVKISSAELIDSSENLEVEPNPAFEGLKINVDVKFAEVDEFAKYKIVLKNDTKKDYEIDTGESFTKGEYIKYEFSLDEEDDNVLKANEEQVLYINVVYNKEVPEDKFTNGVYKEDNAMAINLSTEEEQANPNTKTGYIILATAVVLFISLLLVLLNKYKLDHLMVLVIAIAIALPITIYALEKITVVIEAKIEIKYKDPQFCVNIYGSYDSNIHTTEYYKYRNGMTWEQYLTSNYNENYFVIYERSQDSITYKEQETNVCGNRLTFPNQEVSPSSTIINKKQGCYTFVSSVC